MNRNDKWETYVRHAQKTYCQYSEGNKNLLAFINWLSAIDKKCLLLLLVYFFLLIVIIVLFVNEVLLNLSSLILIPEPDVYMFILNLKRMQLLQLLPTCMI